MDGFFAVYDWTFLRVSNTSAVLVLLAADAGIAKMFDELPATASLVGSLWMESSAKMVLRSCWCPTPVLWLQPMLALP